MKYLLIFIIMVVVGFLAHLILPWWIIWCVCAVVCFASKLQVMTSVLLSFIAGFALWFFYAYYLDHANDSLLANQVGELFSGISAIGLVLITGILGGLLGALGGWTGAIGRKIGRTS